MKRGSTEAQRTRRIVSLLAIAWLIAVPILGQELEAPDGPSAPMSEVPYAVAAESLLAGLALRHDHELVESWARGHGLDPDSTVVQDLLTLALGLEEEYPRGLTAENREELLQQFTGDAEGLRLWSEERRIGRYRAAGEAFGQWLEARRSEGYPPEFLIERLLSRRAALVARASAVSTEQQIPPRFQIEARAFEEGVAAVMGTIPERFSLEADPLH